MYLANNFVKVGRILYRKGDTIPELTAEQEEWLLKVGAIQKIDSPSSFEEEPEIDLMDAVKPKRSRRKKVSNEDKAD